MQTAVHRRTFLKATAAASAALVLQDRRLAAQDLSQEEEQWLTEAIAAFPYEWVEVPVERAFEEWERLKTAGRGAPVIVGGESSFHQFVGYRQAIAEKEDVRESVAKSLVEADRLSHPDDLHALRQVEDEDALESSRKWCAENPQTCGKDAILRDDQLRMTVINPGHLASGGERDREPPLGEWPERPAGWGSQSLLAVTMDLRTGRLIQKVYVLLVPTDDWTTIPAYLHWGIRYLPEYHVAALRSWRDRYGAELVGLGPSFMNIRIQRRPQTREEALALARESYLYSRNTIDLGFRTYSSLAAALMSSDWWFFSWD